MKWQISEVMIRFMRTGGKYDRGIVVCGTGIGVSIAANKVKGAYAACIHDVYQAQRAELSNHANIITMGSQVIGIQLAKELVKEYLSVEWDLWTRFRESLILKMNSKNI